MTNDSDKKHCIESDDEMQAAYERIWELEQTPQNVDSPEALEQLERSLREAADNLTALVLQKHLQASLSTDEARNKEAE